MNTKHVLSGFAIFSLLLFSVAFSSAISSTVFNINNVNFPSSVDEDQSSFTFTFDLTYTGQSSGVDFEFVNSTALPFGSVSIPQSTGFNQGETRTLTGTVSGIFNQGGNDVTVVIDAESATGSRDNETFFTVSINDLNSNNNNNSNTGDNFPSCSAGEVGTLEIADIELNNLGTGDDDKWEPLDEVEIEVEIENTDNDDDVDDVLVELFIYDNNNNDVTNDFDLDDEEIDLGRIKEDDSEFATFKIPEVPADIDEGDYKLLVKAYSEDDEDLHCVTQSNAFSDDSDQFEEIEFDREDDPAVIVKPGDGVFEKILASCGDSGVEVTFPIYNIGSDKEEEILVNLYSSELGIDEYVQVSNLKEGKKKTVSFFIDIPEGLPKSLYKLDIINYFEYDDGDELEFNNYDSNSDDDLENGDFNIPLEILSCGIKKPSIGADLVSDPVVNQDLVIEVEVENTGSSEQEFDISLSGVNSWAEVIEVSPSSVSVGAGDTETVLVTLLPNEAGSQSFVVNAVSSDGETARRTVTVNLAGDESGDESGSGIGSDALSTYLLWGIIILVILIILTLIVKAARSPRSRKSSSADF